MSALVKKKTRTSVMSSVWGVFIEDEEENFAQTLIVGLCFMKDDPGIEALRDVVKERLINENFPRFRSLVRMDKNVAVMDEIEVEEMDLNYHVAHAFDDEGAEVKLEDAYAFISSQYDFENRLDLDKPLWRLRYIPKLEDGRSLCILFVNHILGDGQSQLAVFMNLTESHADDDQQKKMKKKRPPPQISFLHRLKVFAQGVYKASPFAKSEPDVKNALSTVSKKRITGVANRLPLERIKEISRFLDGKYTVNDILMTVLNLTIVEYFREVDPEILDLDEQGRAKKVTGTFPIDMRPKGYDFKKEGTANVVSSGTMQYVFHYDSRLDLMAQLKQIFDDTKISPGPIVSKWLHENFWLRILSEENYKALIKGMYTHNTSMLSNVFGPTEEVTIAGVPVDDLQFFAFSRLALYFGILSYNGYVNATFVLDAEAEPDPTRLSKYWNSEFEKLYEEAQAYASG